MKILLFKYLSTKKPTLFADSIQPDLRINHLE